MAKADITVNYKARLGVFDLRIKDETVGADLSFTLDGKTVWIRLPGDRTRKDYLSNSGWRLSDAGERVPENWHAHWVSVEAVSGAVLHTNINALPHPDDSDEVRMAKARRLDHSDISKAGIVGENFVMSAYETWLRALRRVKMNGTIGRVPRETIMGGTHIVDSFNGHEVFGTGRTSPIFDMRSSVPITLANWRDTETLLKDGGAPVYFDLLFDSEQHFEERQLDRAVLNLAMAAEVFIKTQIRASWPADLGKVEQKVLALAQLEHQLNMFKTTLVAKPAELEEFSKQLQPEIKLIAAARNNVVHTGRDSALTDKQVYGWLKIVRRLLMLGQPIINEYSPVSPRFGHGYLKW